MSEIINPVFICGHRKGGTTVFHNLFDGHPELLVYPSDLNLLYAYFPQYLQPGFSDEQRRERLDKVLFEDLKEQLKINNTGSLIDMDKFRSGFFERVGEDLVDMKKIISSLIMSFASTVNASGKVPVIKETSIEIYATEIFSWFPDAKFIQLLRDPRDNYGALKSGVSKYYSKIGENEKETLASLIHRAKLGMEIGFYNLQKFGPEKYKMLKFEDVISNPEREMKSVADFMNIKFDPVLLSPTRLNERTRGNNFDGNNFSELSATNVGRWKERISETEAQIIEFHFQELMNKLDYKLNFKMEECAQAAAEFYKWQNYRYFYSDRFKTILSGS